MSFASGSKAGLAYVAETVFGTTPAAPVFLAARPMFGIKPGIKRDTFPIKEIRQDRQIADLRYGNKQTGMEVPFGLSYGSFDDWLEALVGGTWTGNVLKTGTLFRSFSMELAQPDINVLELYRGLAPNSLALKVEANKEVTGTFGFIGKDVLVAEALARTLSIDSAAKTITASTGSFITDGFANGMTVVCVGSTLAAGNQAAVFKNITVTSATVLTYTTVTGTPATETNKAGCAVYMATLDSDGAYTAANSNPIYDSFTGTVTEGGNTIAIVTGIDLKIDSALDPAFVVMSDSAQQLTQGMFNLTGTLSVYWQDQSLRKKFLSGASSSLVFTLGTGTKVISFNVPKIYYTGNDRTIGEGSIVETLPFQAVYESGAATALTITRTP